MGLFFGSHSIANNSPNKFVFEMIYIEVHWRFVEIIPIEDLNGKLGWQCANRSKFETIASYKFASILFASTANKGRFLNTIASVALVHTSIQSD